MLLTVSVTIDLDDADEDMLQAVDLAIHNLDSSDVVTVDGWDVDNAVESL